MTKQKQYTIGGILVVGLIGFASLVSSHNPPHAVVAPVSSTASQQIIESPGTVPLESSLIVATPTPLPTPAPILVTPKIYLTSTPTPTPTATPIDGLSNTNTYTNSDGNTIHSPAYSNTVPVGATAQCRDGTYSFSQHRSGTCSHHGGVAEWL